MTSSTSTTATGAHPASMPGVTGPSLPYVYAIPALVLAYGFVYLAFQLRPLEEWQDLFGYVQRYSLDPYYGAQIPDGILDYAFSELGWQLIVRFLFYQGFQFDDAFFFISVLALATTTYVVLTRTRSFLVLLLFVNPALIDFYISQVRSALAFAIMLVAVQRRLPIALLGIAIASTIHTSMLLMAVPVVLNFIREKLAGGGSGETSPSHFWPLIGLAAAILLSTFQVYILDFFEDRRASYVLSDLGAGTLFTLGWSLVGIAFYLCTRSRSTMSGIAVAFLLGMFLGASLYGLYSHRYIPYFLQFMMLSLGAAGTPKESRIVFVAFYAAFSLVYFNYWL